MCEEIQAEQGKAAGMQGSVLGTQSLPATSCSFLEHFLQCFLSLGVFSHKKGPDLNQFGIFSVNI